MAKRHNRKRREARRERRKREIAALDALMAAAPSIRRSSVAFRARGVEFGFELDAQTVQSDGEPLTPDKARARLVERAFRRAPMDG